jgi:hypothetical protein
MATYLSYNLNSLFEIWITLVWMFCAGHFVIHLFIAWYAWRVLKQDKARVAWFWPIIASIASLITAFITIAILGT